MTGSRSPGRPAGAGGSRGGGAVAGLLDLPPVPRREPTSAVLTDPSVPEPRRRCGRCGVPVGQSYQGRPGLAEGFCGRCGAEFSFRPQLSAGDRVEDRYEIEGCLAYGGMGWIYLAKDHHLSDPKVVHWVVLKGLIDESDPVVAAAAIEERRFLTEVDHPSIVRVQDFVQHPDPRTGRRSNYLVMEYVPGQTLHDLRYGSRSGGAPAPLPLPQVLAYGIEILAAMAYLHDRGILYCDLKPSNVMHADRVRLVDLSGARRRDDRTSPVFGTPGYQAPELTAHTAAPSVASDIYTVGRTLARLSFDFPKFTTDYAERLPDPEQVPLLAAEESYHRLLLRATHPEPARRFGSAAQLREQVEGVLREVIGAAGDPPPPAVSPRFGGERRAFGTEAGQVDAAAYLGDAWRVAADVVTAPPAGRPVAAALPLRRPDPGDPSVGMLTTTDPDDPTELLIALEMAPVRSPEVLLRLARAQLEQGRPDRAEQVLAELPEQLRLPAHADWRVDWFRGLAGLWAGDAAAARVAFDAVYSALPGEPAVRLALAVAVEISGGPRDWCERLYERVWRTDRGYVSAAFGLARLRVARGDRGAAAAALDEVPETSRHHGAAQVAAVRVRLAAPPPELTEVDLREADRRLSRLLPDPSARTGRWEYHGVSAELLDAALGWVWAGHQPAADLDLLGHRAVPRELRAGLERAYRGVASGLPREPQLRVPLVEKANQVRPRTWY